MPPRKNLLQLFGMVALAVICTGCNTSPSEITPSQSGLTIEGATPDWNETDWPQWRGRHGNGVATAKSAPTRWSDTENVTWSVEVPGRGHASPTIVDGVVYLATALEDVQQQIVVAYNASDGEMKWQTKVHEGEFPGTSQMHIKSTHANSTVACDGERVFAVFLNHGKVHATALDLEGNIEWQSTLGDFDAQFGYAPSPLIYRSALIVPADHRGGGFIAAVDRATGEIVWRKSRPKISSYSSALIASIDGKDQLVISGCRQVVSYDPSSGKKLWDCAATASGTCGTVVADESSVYASGGFPEKQTTRINANGSGKLEWSNQVRLYEPSLVLTDGRLFGITDEGIAYCWNAESGEEEWKTRLEGQFSASPTVIGDLIYVPNDAGKTFVFRATSDGYQEVARNQLGEGTYASISVSGNSLYIRAVQRGNGKRVERLYRID